MRLRVQVLAADRAETCAVGPAEDLVGKSSTIASLAQAERSSRSSARYSVCSSSSPPGFVAWYSRPCSESESSAASRQRKQGPWSETRKASSRQRAARCFRHDQLGRDRVGLGSVLLAREQERLDLDVDRLAALLAAAERERAEVEGGHDLTVARRPAAATKSRQPRDGAWARPGTGVRGEAVSRRCGASPRGAAPGVGSPPPGRPCAGCTARSSRQGAPPPDAAPAPPRACRPRRE